MIEILLVIAILVLIYILDKPTSKSTTSHKTEHTTNRKSDKQKSESAAAKGAAGESQVTRALLNLPACNYTILNDILIETSSGTTQIDHIVVSRFGVFLIETKNYAGTLVGDEDDIYFSYSFGPFKYDMYNPIKQNATHVRALMSLFHDYNKNHFIPILALSDLCEFKIYATPQIVTFSYLYRTILQYTTPIFTDEEVASMAKTIRENNITSPEERQKHIERVKALEPV